MANLLCSQCEVFRVPWPLDEIGQLLMSEHLKECSGKQQTFTPAKHARTDLLVERIMVAFTLHHYDHAGLPGHPADRCPRCNAERALEELTRRATT